MNLLADEGVDRQIIARFRDEGHDVLYVAEMDPGISDDAVLDLANREHRKLLTADKDFGELVFRQGRLTEGVILARLSGLSPEGKAWLLLQAIDEHEAELSSGTFVVVTPGSIRIRKPN